MAEEKPVVRTRHAARPQGRSVIGLALSALLTLSACAGPQLLPPGPGAATPAIETDGRAFIARDGFRLRWSVWTAEKPWGIVLALHGMNDYGETYKAAAEFWAPRGLTTYAMDQRGFGRTLGDGVWPGTQPLVNDVHDSIQLIAQRHPGLPIFLAGESMGGAVALAALGQNNVPQVRAAALIAPGLQGWSRLSIVERAGLWFIAHVTPSEPLTSRGLNLKPSDNQDRLKAMAADPFVLKRLRADAFYGLVKLMDDAVASAPANKVPVTIYIGGKDDIAPVGPARDLAQKLPDTIAFKYYPAGYHLLLHGAEREQIYTDILAEFRKNANLNNQ
jgi:acylglycerol lipase